MAFDSANTASKVRRMAPPKNLLAWFLGEFRAELPDEIHGQGVWREFVTDDYAHTGGGSLLGAPRYVDAFRRFIEDSAFATEVAELEGHRDLVGHYRFPMRAALATLSGRHACTGAERLEAGHRCGEYPFMARVLYRIGLMDGDVDAACASLGVLEDVRRVYVGEALRRLWARYEIEPPARTIRTEGVA